MTTGAEKIAKAEAKVQRARERRDRAIARYWKLLGWGTSSEVEHASKAVTTASKALDMAEQYLARLQKQTDN